MNNRFGLYLILTNPAAGYDACARAAVAEKVALLQLRMKNTPSERIIETGRRIRKITAGTATRFIVNDDVYIAREVDADGVHLGQDDTSLPEAREIWNRPEKIFGLSTHNEEQAEKAGEVNPDYIGVGPVFPTPTKTPPDPALGLKRMGTIIERAPLPAVAIGGINEKNLEEVLKAGAKNFAVVRAVNQSPTPQKAIRRLQKIWEKIKKFEVN